MNTARLWVHGHCIRLALLREIAEVRSRMHRNDKSRRALSEDYDLIGLLGQWEFSLRSGLPMDLGIRHEGDQGINFISPAGQSISVATYRKPLNLLREAEKPTADIHVLAKVNDDLTGAELVGWEYDRIMLLCPVKTRRGHEVQNHTMPARDLRPIEQLLDMIQEEREKHGSGNEN